MATPPAPGADPLSPVLEDIRPGLALLGFPAYVVDARRRYRYLNAAYESYFGRRSAEMVGRTVEEVFGPPPPDDRRAALDRALAGETLSFDREARHGPRKGRWIRLHYIPVPVEGVVVAATVVLMDIQHLKDAQEAIAERERQLSLITDTIGFPVTYVDREGVVRFANAQSAAWAGLAPDSMIGRPSHEHTPPEILARTRHLMERALAGEAVTYEREALWPGREKRHIRGHMIPDRDASGTVRGVLILVMDIEEDHRLRESLIERTRELQLVMDNVGVPMAYIGADRRFRFSNTPGVDWRPGITVENIVGKPVDEVYKPDVVASIDAYMARALAGEKVVYERQGVAAGGSTRWIRVTLIPDLFAGQVLGVFSVVIDIDDDRRLREALEKQERQLRFYAENIPEAIAFVDADSRFQFANKTYQGIRGQASGEILGRTIREVLGPEAAAEAFDPYLERLRRGEVITYERLAGPAGGKRRWLLIRLEPWMDGAGAYGGCYIVGTDIHELKLARESLAGQEAKLRLFTDNVPVSIAYLDTGRRYVFVNRTFAETRGMRREDIVGHTSAEVLGQDVADQLTPMVERVLAGEPTTYEREVVLPSGERRWLLVRSVPDTGPGGEVRGMYVVGHDVQELKNIQEKLRAREEELRFFAENIPEAIVYIDLERGCTFVNNVFLATRGFTREFLLGKFPKDVYGPEEMLLLQANFDRVTAGEAVSYERTILHAPTGEKRWMRVNLTPRKDAAGRVLGFYVVSHDVHEQRAAEEELRRTHSILSAHVEGTPLAVIEFDPSLRVVRWSGNAASFFGWSADEALGRLLWDWRLVFEDDVPAVDAMFKRLIHGPDSQATHLNRNYRKDGSVIWVEWHNSALRNADGRLVSILSFAQDVSTRIQAEERLQYMATHDGLTGLPNRLVLNDRLSGALARAQRSGHGVGVVFLDLDHFKDVNDTLGHRVGDELLKALARRLRGALRQSDLLARISGDEFVIVLEDLESEGSPDRVAQKVLDEVLRPFPIEGHEVKVSASLGYAIHPEDGADAETLLKNADAAMYHAKELGRNSYRAFSRALAQRRDERLGLESALRRAIRDREFELHYQPILDVVTGRVAHVEALIRWHDPVRGLVLPPTFVPLAEEAGLMRDVGHWVLETAARQAAAWNAGGRGPFTIGVNLSASQLRDSTIVPELEAILAAAGCAPTWLTLEITETSMVKDLEGVSLTLRKLRRLGFRIAIDDFGTGFSSLSHLRHLPVDSLKIDRSFVADINAGDRRAAESGGAAIVAAVTGLARGLGLEVVAEGVERPDQLAFLRELGCGAFQGYLACPPMPVSEFERWLAKQAPGAPAPKRTPARKAAAKKPGAKKPVAKKPGATRK